MKPILMLLASLALLSGCVNVKTEPIRVEPIEITMNVNLRIDRELNDFFGDLDQQSNAMEIVEPPAEQP